MIRNAEAADLEEVFALIHAAFSSNEEADLVKKLIADDDVLVNLVFVSAGAILGNVVVSRVSMGPNPGALLCGGVAPLSVRPDHQSKGIGSALMQAAIEASKGKGIDALFLLGDPAYYRRFGFVVSDLESDYSPEHFQQLELSNDCLKNSVAKITYAKAFQELP